jgi:DNA polymerase-1
MTKGTKASVNTKQLRDLVELVAHGHGYKPKRSEKTGEISIDKETIGDLAPHNPLLELYAHRQKWAKIQSTYLPMFYGADSIHPDFNVLVETGRTSSSGSKLYPSTNIQNIPQKARPCFKAREGYYLCSIDYDFVELVSLAQKCYTLFGQSTLRDLINSGGDPHAYLGAQLALHFHEDFRLLCEEKDIAADAEAVYRTFAKCKGSEDEEVRAFFKKWRTFAKPTGLGYPGGLGAATFVGYAKTTFGVIVSHEEAEMMKQVWFNTFPEMRLYFDWVNAQEDPNNIDSYAYTTPFGMYRAGTTYCACANGAALQSPTGEGAKLAILEVVKNAYHSQGSLRGCFPVAFIHDEMLIEVPVERAHEMALEAARLMIEAMEVVMPDVKVGAEPALMLNWDKRAEPVFNDAGELIPWEPPAIAA